MIFISIHAPRVGGDITDVSLCRRPDNFNPRPPCGGRPCPARRRKRRWEFQSTPPVWGATLLAEGQEDILRHFNPRPPCGGRLRCSLSPWRWTPFQSTPPVWGATRRAGGGVGADRDFNPRPPCGGRLHHHPPDESGRDISIHAPRVGGDDRPKGRKGSQLYFNPRPPCGGRPRTDAVGQACVIFQSTPPVWGATMKPIVKFAKLRISIHAPRVGGDLRAGFLLL